MEIPFYYILLHESVTPGGHTLLLDETIVCGTVSRNLVCEHTLEVNVCFSWTLLFFSQDEKIDEDQKIEQHQVLYGNF